MECRRSTNSCGIKEVEGIGKKSPRTIMAEVMAKFGSDSPWGTGAYVTFTTPISRGNMEALRDYITKLDIGDVIMPEPAKNPNSGNIIGLVVWRVDHEKLAVYKKKCMARTLARYKEGTIARVVGNRVGHHYLIGQNVTIKKLQGTEVYVKEGSTFLNIRDIVITRKKKTE